MSIAIAPVTPAFAAEIGDVDLTQPLAESDFAEIQNAFWQYSVLIFPGQDLTQDQHLAFGQRGHHGHEDLRARFLSLTAAGRAKLASITPIASKNNSGGVKRRRRRPQPGGPSADCAIDRFA